MYSSVHCNLSHPFYNFPDRIIFALAIWSAFDFSVLIDAYLNVKLRCHRMNILWSLTSQNTQASKISWCWDGETKIKFDHTNYLSNYIIKTTMLVKICITPQKLNSINILEFRVDTVLIRSNLIESKHRLDPESTSRVYSEFTRADPY